MLKKAPLYPLFFALYPAAALLAQNISQVDASAALRPLAFSLLGSVLLYLLMGLVLRRWERAAALTLLAQVAFFSYGHLLHAVRGLSGLGTLIGRNVFLVPLLALLVLSAAWGLLRSRRDLRTWTPVLNLVTAALLLFVGLQLGWFYLRQATAQRPSVSADALHLPTGRAPDVYLIVLDSYARSDVLQQDLDEDNRAFVEELKKLGFQVPSCSRSNYNNTIYSLTAMLNLNYLDQLSVPAEQLVRSEDGLIPLFKHNRVKDLLEQAGYKTVAFQSGYAFLDWWDSRWFFYPDRQALLTQRLQPFETLFLKTTAFSLAIDYQMKFAAQPSAQASVHPYQDHIQLERFILNKLSNINAIAGPKFVYAHLAIPHRPLVFAADGSPLTDVGYFTDGDPVDWEHFRSGYTNQVEFVNSQILPIVRNILDTSTTPPVIVVMGDHGYYWGDTHYENLLALYLPPSPNQPALAANMTNVNVFRRIFSQVFGMDLPQLPDQSLQLDPQTAQFQTVPETLTCPNP